MTNAEPAHRLLRREWRLLGGLLPGLLLLMVNTTLLNLTAVDVTNGLGSDRYRIQWIIGSFGFGFMAGCMVTPLIAGLVGMGGCYRASLLLFALAGGWCGLVDDVFWMTPLRLAQGFGLGLALNSSMILLWQRSPAHMPAWMALYAVAAFVGALLGAPLGGLLTYWLSWRWMFLIQWPLGALALAIACWGLPNDRPADPRWPHLDVIHLAITLGWLVCLTVVLDMGQFWGWLDSPFLVPWLAGMVVLFAGFVAWGSLRAAPLISVRPLAQPRYALAFTVLLLVHVNVYVLIDLLGRYMIDLRGYQWWQGAAVLFASLPAVLAFICLGLGRQGPSRGWHRLFLGLMVMALATWWLSFVDLYTSKYWIALLMAAWGGGLGLALVPATMHVFDGLTLEQALSAAGIYNINRFLPAFVVAATLGILLSRNTDAEMDRMRLRIAPNRPEVSQTIHHLQRDFTRHSGRTDAQDQQAHAALGKWVQANARAFAMQTILKYLALCTVLGPLLLLLGLIGGRREHALLWTTATMPTAPLHSARGNQEPR